MPSSICISRWPLRARSSSIFDASSTVSEVRIAAVAGVSSPRSSRAPRSSFSFSLAPGAGRRDSSCASMARLICLRRSTGATTPMPKTASQTMPTSASPLSITNPTETSRIKRHHTPTPSTASILVSIPSASSARLVAQSSDPGSLHPAAALHPSAALKKVYARGQLDDSRSGQRETPVPDSRYRGFARAKIRLPAFQKPEA